MKDLAHALNFASLPSGISVKSLCFCQAPTAEQNGSIPLENAHPAARRFLPLFV